MRETDLVGEGCLVGFRERNFGFDILILDGEFADFADGGNGILQVRVFLGMIHLRVGGSVGPV